MSTKVAGKVLKNGTADYFAENITCMGVVTSYVECLKFLTCKFVFVDLVLYSSKVVLMDRTYQ